MSMKEPTWTIQGDMNGEQRLGLLCFGATVTEDVITLQHLVMITARFTSGLEAVH